MSIEQLIKKLQGHIDNEEDQASAGYEERKRAFDLIMSLGLRYDLFLEVSQNTKTGLGGEIFMVNNVSIIDPVELIKREC